LIYFIHDEQAGAIKIGKADNPRKRLVELQVGCASRLVLLAMIPGGDADEGRLHRQFRHLKVRGEWFRADDDLMEFAGTIEAKKMGPFLELVKVEPGLGRLFEEAGSYRETKSNVFCANAVWYGYPGHRGIKPRLLELVGWRRRGDDRLGTCEAYDIAYHTIYQALPDCRGECECTVVFNALVGA
jgi:hypothetical protein